MIRCGLVLAAGRSSRFGAADKLLADFRGKPLVAHAADAMRAVALDHRLAVVANPEVGALFGGFEVLTVTAPGAPQSRSLALGARRAKALGAARLLVALSDMPLVDADLLASVLARCTDARPSAAVDGARISPPACFPAARLDPLARLEGDRGAAALLGDLPGSALVEVRSGMLDDIDTRDDLVRLRAAPSFMASRAP